MNRWKGKVAVVTGASAGIGAQIVKDLVKNGMKVMGLARRVEVVEKIGIQLKGSTGHLKPFKCDIRDAKEIEKAFSWVESHWGPIHVLVNCAGVMYFQTLQDIEMDALKSTFDTNVIALSLCSQLAVKSMKKHAVPEGHIININSYVGHVIFGVPGMTAYSASKNSVRVLTEALRRELGPQNRTIKVTSLSPGLVGTELCHDLNVSEDTARLEAQDVSDAVLYVISTPPGINVTELTIMKTGDVIF